MAAFKKAAIFINMKNTNADNIKTKDNLVNILRAVAAHLAPQSCYQI